MHILQTNFVNRQHKRATHGVLKEDLKVSFQVGCMLDFINHSVVHRVLIPEQLQLMLLKSMRRD